MYLMNFIFHFSKEVQWIPTNKLENTTVTGQEIMLKDSGSSYVWDGKTVGGEKIYRGKSCMPLAPDLSPNDESLFIFDKQLLMDFGVQLQLSDEHEAPISKIDSKKRRCKLCKKDIELEYMRLHVAQHILKDNIASPTLCGFCGKSTCTVSLTNTSKKRG